VRPREDDHGHIGADVLAAGGIRYIHPGVGAAKPRVWGGISSPAPGGPVNGIALDARGAVRAPLCLLLLGAGCALDHAALPESEIALAAAIPPFGQPDTLDVATWNMEWFGSSNEGPGDEERQLAGARALVAGLDLDLWAVEEVVSADQFDDLLAGLPYAGLLANHPSVEGNSSYSAGEQKVGIIYRPDLLELVEARTILREHNWDFAGRPPLEVTLRDAGGSTFHVIVFHAKAARAFTDWERRRDGSLALAEYLAGERAGDDVILIGDYNDDLDESTRGPSTPSPYANLAASWFFATWAIAVADEPTTQFSDQPIDHALAAGALADAYVDGSAEVFRADDYIDDFGWTVSDHFPVMMRFASGDAPPDSALLINEILANEPGSDTAGEFVELVNAGASAIDLAGFTVADSLEVRHVMPAGTTIAAGAALVVASGGLGLSNSGDTVTLADASGRVVDRVIYSGGLASRDGVSMTRASDGDRDSSMVLHDELSPLQASPGTRRDGSPF
jgi:endonuclease/exonuclease/phosphatase family metal-dependent hydrolase